MLNKENSNQCTTFAEGDKISWQAIVSGKVVKLVGRVSSISETDNSIMCCIGKCKDGNWWRDYVSIHDKSIKHETV